jgi:hypothetical protein
MLIKRISKGFKKIKFKDKINQKQISNWEKLNSFSNNYSNQKNNSTDKTRHKLCNIKIKNIISKKPYDNLKFEKVD